MAFFNTKFNSAHKDVSVASIAIQTYVAAILRQPDLKLDALPQLPEHQKTAREHAQSWLDKVLPNIVKTNADIIDYANSFLSFYDKLIELAKQIDDGDKTNIKTFADGLVILRNVLTTKETASKNVENQIEDFKSNLSVDYDEFTKDAAAATKLLEGDDGAIKKINDEIDSVNSQLNTYIGMMSGGAVGIVGGITMILVGSFATIETAGISSSLIVAGTGLLVGGIGSDITGGVEYSLAVKRKKELLEELATDKQGIGAIKHIHTVLDGFVSQMDDALKSVSNLRDQWSQLGADLDKVIADLDKNPGSLGLVAQLKSAKGDWGNTLDFARRMEPRATMPVKQVNKIQDVFNNN